MSINTSLWGSVGSLLMPVKYVHYTLLKIPSAALHGQILQATYPQWVSMIKMSFLCHNPFQSFHQFVVFILISVAKTVNDHCGLYDAPKPHNLDPVGGM